MLSFRPRAGLRRPLLALMGCLLSASAAGAQATESGDADAAARDFERTYRIELGGQAAGWVVETGATSAEHFVTETSTRMEVSRAGTATAMEMSSRFVETRDHRPVTATVRQQLGARPLVTRYRFDDEGVEVIDEDGSRRRRPPADDPWLTPAAAAEYLTTQVRRAYDAVAGDAADGDEVSFEVRRLEPLVGLEPITGRYVLQDADDPVAVDGELRAAGRWAASESYAPLVTTLIWLAPDGTLLRSEAHMMGTTMVTVLTGSDPRIASDPPRQAQLTEMLVRTFVEPTGHVETPREVRRATYRLRVAGLDLSQLLTGAALPSRGVQTARPEGDGLRITVDLSAATPAGPLPDRQRYLDANRYLDHDSAAVMELLETWRHDEDGEDVDRAESLRRLVGSHLEDKHLGTVLGTASDAARDRAGDCTEHAVLLAALLRAEGIPSRLAVGLVYTESFAGRSDIFAYHLWTQAFLSEDADGTGRWVDLDATLPAATAFDATHILFATSDFSDDGVPLLGTGVEAVFGRLEIEIAETSR